MRALFVTLLFSVPFFTFAEAPEIGAGVSGPYVECHLSDGKMEYTPELICKNKGGTHK